MKYPWMDAYCLAKTGAAKEYKATWDATLYTVGGKMFALHAEDNKGRAILNLKIEPSYGNLLRQDYADIIPGYHMNKLHWVSVLLTGNVPDEVFKEMIDESHGIVFRSLSKKMRKELEESA